MTDSGGHEPTDFELQGFPEHSPDTELRSRVPVEILASQFVEELRDGKRPTVEEYAARFPVHAEAIRDSFPVLAMLEQARIQNEAASIRQSMPEKFPFRKLGRCELLCELGRGGMGVVFQARESDSNHIVAVKLLPWRVSIVPEWQKKFEKEARTTASLRHRNIVPVFRFGQEHGYCYYVMQFVNGIGLDVIIKRLNEVNGVVYQDEIQREESTKPTGFVTSIAMPAITDEMLTAKRATDELEKNDNSRRRKLTKSSWKSFAQIAVQVTQALRYAHDVGILHNDIKPGNVLLDGGGRVWVTDFGLSEPIEAQGDGIQRVMGTLRYMAPERLAGDHDERSDIYSLGITLYELLTLKPAYEAKDEDEMVSRILDKSPPNPRDIVKEIPDGLATIVMNCIARHPPCRYVSAEALLQDLQRFIRDERVASLTPWRVSTFLSSLSKKLPRLRDTFNE